MNSRLKHYFEKCVEHVITHTVWAILSHVASVVVLNIPNIFLLFGEGSVWLSDISRFLTPISCVLLCVIILVWVVAFKNKDRYTRKEDRAGDGATTQSDPSGGKRQGNNEEHTLNNDREGDSNSKVPFRFKKVTISLIIASCTSIEYIMKYDGFATQENVEYFANHLSWSGTEYIETTLVSSSVEAHLEDNIEKRDHSPYSFKIVFDEDVALNERIKFTTKTVLSDQGKSMMPISSFCVKYPIDELVLSVSAPIGLLHTMRKKCYRDAGREYSVFSSKSVEHQDVDGYRTFSFSQKDPTPWLFYVLEWMFSEQYRFEGC